jgi:hypothetical protein
VGWVGRERVTTASSGYNEQPAPAHDVPHTFAVVDAEVMDILSLIELSSDCTAPACVGMCHDEPAMWQCNVM